VDPGADAESGTAASDYDLSVPFNVPVWYRVRTLMTINGFSASGINYPAQQYTSPWSNTVEVTPGPTSNRWWVIPPSDPTAAMALYRLRATGAAGSGTSLQTPAQPPSPQGLTTSIAFDEQEQLGIFRGFGRKTAIVVHGDIWAPEFDLSLYFESDAEFDAFQAIRDLQDGVLLKSDMDGSYYWVTLGPDFNRGILRETGRMSNPKSGLTVHCTPTDPEWPNPITDTI
jgi:hypothetical protein